MSRRARKAIEPLIAAIILVAITIVIAIAVVGWIMGVFGTSSTQSEQLIIYPNASLKFISNNQWLLNITVLNKGSATIEIISVSAGNNTCSTASIPPVAVQPGQIRNITNLICSTQSGAYVNGIIYEVKVMTSAGSVFFSQVVAQK